MIESKLIAELRAHAAKFPFRVDGSDGYPFGGEVSKADAERSAKFLERFTQHNKNPIKAVVVDTTRRGRAS